MRAKVRLGDAMRQTLFCACVRGACAPWPGSSAHVGQRTGPRFDNRSEGLAVLCMLIGCCPANRRICAEYR